jgi:hypothetical protein
VSLTEFVDELDRSQQSLVVVNREAPEPVQRMLVNLFDDQPVSVSESDLPDRGSNVVLLLDDDEVVASSPLAAFQDAILFVNSDIYITGARDLEDLTVPDVIRELDDVPFRLLGYPESHHQKLLLITMSRIIERRAMRADTGTLRTSFQRLSRIDDESGTRTVYERLAETGVDVHVYGIPDWTPPPEFRVTMHGGYDEPFERSWFVVFTPETGDDHAALLAYERAPRTWEGFWTYRRGLTLDIARHIERTM